MLTFEDFVRAKRTDKAWTEERLRAAFESRSRCSLCPKYCDDPHTGIVKVDSRGSDSPVILLVGEAPGKDESREGKAFVGLAGEHLNKMLAQAGVSQEMVRFTNGVRCFPHDQNLSPKPPEYPEIVACLPYLFDEIDELKPKVIVTLGRSATEYLLDSTKLSISSTMNKLSGNVYKVSVRSTEYHVVPCFHPSADLRSGGIYANRIVSALAFAKGLAVEEEVPVRANVLNDTLDAITYLKGLLRQYEEGKISEVAYDLEYETSMSNDSNEADRLSNFDVFDTTKKLVAASFATDTEEGFSIPLYNVDSKVDVAAVEPYLREVISTIPIVCHGFLKAEGPWTRQKLGVTPNLHRDTMLMSYAVYMRTRSHGLKGLARTLLGWSDWSTPTAAWLNSQPPETRSYRYMPVDVMGRYSAIDPVATLALKQFLEKKIDEENLWQTYKRRHDLSLTMLDIEQRGALVDEESLERNIGEYESKVKELLAKLKDTVEAKGFLEPGVEFNPNSSPQIATVLFSGFGAPILKINPKPGRNEKISKQCFVSLKKGATVLPYALDIPTPSFWIGELSGEVGSEKVSVDTDSNNPNAVFFKDPLKYDHVAPITITRGSPSTDDDVLISTTKSCLCPKCGGYGEDCTECSAGVIPGREELFAFLCDLRLYKKLVKTVRDFFSAIKVRLVPGTNKLICNYLLHTTQTGRLSARNMNIQQFPSGSDVRRLFVSKWYREGGLISSMDQSQLELRILAVVSDDPGLREIYFTCSNEKCGTVGDLSDRGKCRKCKSKLGADMHKASASAAYNVPISEVTKLMRRNAKSVSFGIVYGESAYGLAHQLGCSEQEAQEKIDNFLNRFPGVGQWIERQHQLCLEVGESRSLTGAKLFFEGWDSEERRKQSEALRYSQNYCVQGAGGEIVIDALNLSHRLMRGRDMMSHPWQTTHDSIIFDLHPSEIVSAIRLGKSCMEERLQDMHPWINVPLMADVNIGVRWDGELSLEDFDDNHLEVKGMVEFYDELVASLRKNHVIKEEIVGTFQGDPPELILPKKGYSGGSGRLDGVHAIVRFS